MFGNISNPTMMKSIQSFVEKYFQLLKIDGDLYKCYYLGAYER